LPVALIIAWHQGNQYLVSDVNDTKTFLTFLAFVVALAAYLANVAREIIKKLNDAKGDDRLKLKCNIAWTTAAEMQLVALGLFVFVRIIFGKDPFIPTPFIREPILLDNIIWIYLGLTLLLLAFLHFRVWKNECPFDIHKDSK
jgi:4-hydroxybenzoate polyprenyltransferase